MESNVAGDEIPSRYVIREVRPPSRGLLILYPLTSTKDDESPIVPVDNYALGVCVSLPSRLKGRSLRYTVNSIWRREQDPSEIGDWNEDGRPVE